jgi:cytochrome c oxidase subunit III
VTIVLLFIGVIAVIAGWWLAKQRLMSKPWLEESMVGDVMYERATLPAQTKIGLGIFLVVVSSLFVLLISAYSMRMQAPDWRDLPVPDLLWLNTAILVLSSVALHGAQVAARRVEIGRGQMIDVKIGLLSGAAFAIMFLVGQVLAWRQLTGAGYLLASNPANAFFYLLAGLHGVHLIGGLVALGRAGRKVWRDDLRSRIRLSVGLCAAYWHFLFLVWLVVLGMLAGWVEDFLVICGRLLS